MSFEQFDKTVEETIQRYAEMQEQLTFPLLFEENDTIKCLDVGCGAGRSAYEILVNFQNARVDCIDLNTEKAKNNLKEFEGRTDFIDDDFVFHEFEEQYDVVVCSFTFSQLEKKEKIRWIKKIKSLLVEGGYFVCADKVCFKSVELNEALEIFDTGHSHPVPLVSEMILLKKAGFSIYDITWRFRGYAVWYAIK
ncbi:MAG TPA: class I SAM-dependent methyltransferase [archaeon]|nr:class I SAM-dependent methyltransferase [archaeon]